MKNNICILLFSKPFYQYDISALSILSLHFFFWFMVPGIKRPLKALRKDQNHERLHVGKSVQVIERPSWSGRVGGVGERGDFWLRVRFSLPTLS